MQFVLILFKREREAHKAHPVDEFLEIPEPDETGNVIEEVVDLARQINLEVYSDVVQEQLDSHNQELTIDEFIEMHEACGNPVVKLSDHDRHVMSSSPAPLKTHRVRQRCTLNLPIDGLNINVALFSYTRAFGDGPRYFEPWSSDVDDT
ncbi:hypothetical protein TNCV_1372881 [Trichonephila clavipes]|uniref:Uncharacterized protein n=1 Tax=Trichonephila clavipes TaxID=2585209 RepID=A0A8X6WGF0_TRICX|nr:hypothetical protein TNCV_1372881 [Trichonephila clavipes]